MNGIVGIVGIVGIATSMIEQDNCVYVNHRAWPRRDRYQPRRKPKKPTPVYHCYPACPAEDNADLLYRMKELVLKEYKMFKNSQFLCL